MTDLIFRRRQVHTRALRISGNRVNFKSLLMPSTLISRAQLVSFRAASAYGRLQPASSALIVICQRVQEALAKLEAILVPVRGQAALLELLVRIRMRPTASRLII